MSRTFNITTDNDLSPIYLKLYQKVAQLPAIENIQERMLKDLREASVVQVSYAKTHYGNRVEVHAEILLGGQREKVTFQATGDDPNVLLEDDHLVDAEELLDVYFDKVGRTGKPIRPHGLVQEGTVRQGAEPRGRNAFAPWMLTKLFFSDQYTSAKKRMQHQIARDILEKLAIDKNFVDFSERTSMQAIVDKLKEYSHLPPETLHRAIDLMYVETAMEQ